MVIIPEAIKRLPPKACMPKMISYLAHKHDDWEHDQVVAFAASECGISRKNDYGLDAGIRAALQLAHYKSKYPSLTLKENLSKSYRKIKKVNDFVENFIATGEEAPLGNILFGIAQDFEDFNEDEYRDYDIFIDTRTKDEDITWIRALYKSKGLYGNTHILNLQERDLRDLLQIYEGEKTEGRDYIFFISPGEFIKTLEKSEYKPVYIGDGEISKYERGRGWWGESERHSRARKTRKADFGELKRSHKCKYCDNQATKAYVWADGRAYIPVCEDHKEKARNQIENINKDKIEQISKLPIKKYSQAAKKGKKDLLTQDVFGKEKKEARTKAARIAKREKAMKAKVGAAKRTPEAQAIRKHPQLGPETFEVGEPEALSKPFTIINTETGNIITGEVIHNINRGTIQMTPVSSSDVRAAGVSQNELQVEFHEGDVPFYRYQFETPEMAREAHESLTSSPSPGRWVWQNLRGHSKGEPVTQSKIGPAIMTGNPTIGGTSASLVPYKTSKVAVSRVVGYKKAGEELRRKTSNIATDPNVGSRLEALMGTRKELREMGLKKFRGDIIEDSTEGRWVTMRGTHIYIKKGQSPKEALDENIKKFSKGKPKERIWKKVEKPKTKTKSITKLSPEAKEKKIKTYRKQIKNLQAKLDDPDIPHGAIKTLIKESYKDIEALGGTRMGYADTRKTLRTTLSRLKKQDQTPKIKDQIRRIQERLEEIKGKRDFSMTGLLTRSGAFDYRAEGEGIKWKIPENLKQIVESTEHVPVFGKRTRGSHIEDSNSLIGYAHNLSFIPQYEIDNFAHIQGDVEMFYDIHDLSDLNDPNNLPVSFGFDDIGSDGIQHISKLHHLAVSLNKLEVDRCSIGGPPCTISIKKDLVKPLRTYDFTTYDQNLTEVVSIPLFKTKNQEKFTEDTLKDLTKDLTSRLGDGELFEDKGDLFYFVREEKKLYELDFDNNLIKTEQICPNIKNKKDGTIMKKKEKKSEDLKTEDSKTEIQDGQKVTVEAEGDDDEVEEKIKGDPYQDGSKKGEKFVKKGVKMKDLAPEIQELINESIKEGLAKIKEDFQPIIKEKEDKDAKKLKKLQDLLQKDPYKIPEETMKDWDLKKSKKQKDFLDSLPFIKESSEHLTHEDVNKGTFDFSTKEDPRTSVLAAAQAKFVSDMGGARK